MSGIENIIDNNFNYNLVKSFENLRKLLILKLLLVKEEGAAEWGQKRRLGGETERGGREGNLIEPRKK